MQKKIIYIDLDDVVAGCNVDYSKGKYKQKGFFKNLEPCPNAVNSVSQLFRNANFEVYFLSTPSWSVPDSWGAKRIWVENYFGALAHKRLILSHNKGLNSGDYLIDDNINNAKGFDGEFIHFGSSTFPDWDSVMNYLIKDEGFDFNTGERALTPLQERMLSTLTPLVEDGKIKSRLQAIKYVTKHFNRVDIDEANRVWVLINRKYPEVWDKGGSVASNSMNLQEYADIWYNSGEGVFSKVGMEQELNKLENLKMQLELKKIKPSKIIGTGFKNPRKTAFEYLEKEIEKAKRLIDRKDLPYILKSNYNFALKNGSALGMPTVNVAKNINKDKVIARIKGILFGNHGLNDTQIAYVLKEHEKDFDKLLDLDLDKKEEEYDLYYRIETIIDGNIDTSIMYAPFNSLDADDKREIMGDIELNAYEDTFNEWHDVGNGTFAYSTKSWTIMYGVDNAKEYGYIVGLSRDPDFLESSEEPLGRFYTLEEAEKVAMQEVKKLTGGRNTQISEIKAMVKNIANKYNE